MLLREGSDLCIMGISSLNPIIELTQATDLGAESFTEALAEIATLSRRIST